MKFILKLCLALALSLVACFFTAFGCALMYVALVFTDGYGIYDILSHLLAIVIAVISLSLAVLLWRLVFKLFKKKTESNETTIGYENETI